MEEHQTTPTSPAPSGVTATLAVVDIVVLVVYFLLILAVGVWVSLEGERLLLQYLRYTSDSVKLLKKKKKKPAVLL